MTTYDYRHRQARKRFQSIVDSGYAMCTEPVCLMTTREIPAGSPWDLAHDDSGDWRGPAHPKCNRSEGATRGNLQRNRPARWVL